MKPVEARELDHRVQIEHPVADEAFDGAGSGSWTAAGKAWASVRDVLPARGEQLRDGAPIATRRAKVRLFWREDVTPGCRLVLGDRIMQIVAGPAEIGRRQGLECIVEDYSPAGNPA